MFGCFYDRMRVLKMTSVLTCCRKMRMIQRLMVGRYIRQLISIIIIVQQFPGLNHQLVCCYPYNFLPVNYIYQECYTKPTSFF